MKNNQIIVVVEDGMVQHIIANNNDIQVYLIDKDNLSQSDSVEEIDELKTLGLTSYPTIVKTLESFNEEKDFYKNLSISIIKRNINAGNSIGQGE